MEHRLHQIHHFPEIGVPLFWPFSIALAMGEQSLEFKRKNIKFLEEIAKTEGNKIKPEWATPNKKLYELHTFTLRDFSKDKQDNSIPVFILPPYAGHTSVIADFHKKQSLVETLQRNGVKRIFLTDWHSATLEMKNYDIDNYLAELHIAINDMGGRIHLVGLCQGGWMAALYAARFPNCVASLVLAGSPIDTQVGKGVIRESVNTIPFSFYEELVLSGGGLLKGTYMLQGFKNMHPQQQFIEKYIKLYEHIEDPDYLKRTENFERWYEYTIDLPGRWYLQVVSELFKKNNFIKGKFIGLGKKLNPKDIVCPVYLLAGVQDDITPQEQVFRAEKYFGTQASNITKVLAEGGHIGLFIGNKALSNNWPKIAAWFPN